MGQLEATEGLSLEGRLALDGEAVPQGQLADAVPVAYVKQDDLFYEQMTVGTTYIPLSTPWSSLHKITLG